MPFYLMLSKLTERGRDRIKHDPDRIMKVNTEIEEARVFLAREKEEVERLLLSILPVKVAEELRRNGTVEPVFYPCASVLFTDFQGFTKVARTMTPKQLVAELPVGLEVQRVHWQSRVVDEAISGFLINFAEAVGIVLVVLTLGMGWRLASIVGIALIAIFALGATQGTPDELTLRRLAIIDDDGKERIVAATRPEGAAGLSHYDADGKMRISAGTNSKGDASVQHFDPHGRQRINVGTGPEGEAVLDNNGRDEKERIGVLSFPDGYSGIALRSSNGESVWMKTSE